MRPTSTMRRALSVLAAGVAAAALVGTTVTGSDDRRATDGLARAAIEGDPARRLAAAVSVDDALAHLSEFGRLAASHGGNRAFGSPGHEASARYVHDTLAEAGYQVRYQEFTYPFSQTLAQRLTVLGPGGGDLPTVAMAYSPSAPPAGLTAPLAVVPVDDGTGCTTGDFAGRSFTGTVALIRAGKCRYAEKSANAAKAGVVAVLVAENDSDHPDRPIKGTLGSPDATTVPTAGISYSAGRRLVDRAEDGEVRVRLDVRTSVQVRETRNVIAETGGRGDVVMAGAHLDSVAAGPGVNDNGSGSAALLEVAVELARTQPRRPVRFAWWTAEEFGLIGSSRYLEEASGSEARSIAAYLNFDMIASPNGTRGVYDGDGSLGGDPAPPKGSAALERLFAAYFDSVGLPYEEVDLGGRSDHAPFAERGIPVGGLFTGADGVKNEEQRRRYGGRVGVAADPCYHQACDAIGNVDRRLLEQNLRAIAYAVAKLGDDGPGLRRRLTVRSVPA